MTVFDWLEKPTDSGATVLRRLTELMMVNGGTLRVSAWGGVQKGGLYGRTGLTMDEALELIYLDGFLQGLLQAHDNRDNEAVKKLIEQEIDRHEQAQE